MSPMQTYQPLSSQCTFVTYSYFSHTLTHTETFPASSPAADDICCLTTSLTLKFTIHFCHLLTLFSHTNTKTFLASSPAADDSFSKAAQILITWLERGDCNKRNAGTFYSMIQSTNSHVRRLMTEKGQYEEELAKFREQTRARMQGVVMQCKCHSQRLSSSHTHSHLFWFVSC